MITLQIVTTRVVCLESVSAKISRRLADFLRASRRRPRLDLGEPRVRGKLTRQESDL